MLTGMRRKISFPGHRRVANARKVEFFIYSFVCVFGCLPATLKSLCNFKLNFGVFPVVFIVILVLKYSSIIIKLGHRVRAWRSLKI